MATDNAIYLKLFRSVKSSRGKRNFNYSRLQRKIVSNKHGFVRSAIIRSVRELQGAPACDKVSARREGQKICKKKICDYNQLVLENMIFSASAHILINRLVFWNCLWPPSRELLTQYIKGYENEEKKICIFHI